MGRYKESTLNIDCLWEAGRNVYQFLYIHPKAADNAGTHSSVMHIISSDNTEFLKRGSVYHLQSI